MRPDKDMMRIALAQAGEALDAVSNFNVRLGWSFMTDATHSGAYAHVRELADNLQKIGASLHRTCLDADERLGPASRIQSNTTE